jgi:hypothetical protein
MDSNTSTTTADTDRDESGLIADLAAVTRSSAKPGHLRAWLEYALRFAERAGVSLHLQPGETADAVEAVAAEFGDRVVVRTHVSPFFSNEDSFRGLRELLTRDLRPELVYHCDRDEFIDEIASVRRSVANIRAGKADHAQGWMRCRLAPGCKLYPDDLRTREEFASLAPVQTCVVKAYHGPHLKVWLTKAPDVCMHWKGKNQKRGDKTMAALDHFRWNHNLLDLAKEKAFTYLMRHPNDAKGHTAVMARDAILCLPDFRRAAEREFYPASSSFSGWFDYDDVYRAIARHLNPQDTFVELGVWHGKSLGYFCEFATLLGKHFNVYGVDQFLPEYYLGTPRGGLTHESWAAEVQASLRRVAPFCPPQIIVGDTVQTARDRFPDDEVSALWVDAGHTADDVERDLRAWLPKLKRGAVLAGHDYSFATVREGIARVGLSVRAISRNSWIAVGDEFASIAM